jgi:hypothetical protein
MLERRVVWQGEAGMAIKEIWRKGGLSDATS